MDGLPRRLPTLAAALLLASVLAGPASALVWEFETLDSTAYIGFEPSLALDAGGSPAVAYNHPGTGRLVYAAWNGTAWAHQPVDPAAAVHAAPSLALDGSGNPRIAYQDFASQDLKYAAWTGTAWTVTTVDAAGDVGYAPSLALDAGGAPRIAYYDYTHECLKFAAWTGTGWALSTVDPARWTGTSSSLVLQGGSPRIAYYATNSQGDGVVRYAAWNGAGWSLEEVGAGLANYGGAGVSLALDSLGSPRVAFYDGLSGNLRYAVRGTAWQVETLEACGTGGGYPSLAVYGDTPRIAYVDASGRLRFAAKPAASWQTEVVDAVSSGAHPSLRLLGNGTPRIAYYDSGQLRLARAVPAVRAIGIETAVSVDNGATWHDADEPYGPGVVAGRPVRWRYVVRNTGNVPLVSVRVEDSRDGVAVTVPKTALAVGESLTATSGGAALPGPQACTGTAYGTYGAIEVSASDPANWLGLVLLAVPPGADLPTDTGGDGVYDDVNGNGRTDFADVVLYFNAMSWIAENEPVGLFDCNRNGRVDFADVVWLFNHL